MNNTSSQMSKIQPSTVDLIEFRKSINRPLILDGAIGSYLESQYPEFNNQFTWMNKINSENSEILEKLYEDYINFGADIITSNTFGTQPVKFKKAGPLNLNVFDSLDLSEESVHKAIGICKNIKEKYDSYKSDGRLLIAGSNSPLEDCYSVKRTLGEEELRYNHQVHIDFLYKHGCDFILNETQGHFDEIKVILDHCKKNDIPFAISLYINDDLRLLSGEKAYDVIKFIDDYNTPLFIGLNCISLPNFLKFLSDANNIKLINNMKSYFGFYLNCGSINFDNGKKKSIKPEDIKSILKDTFSLINMNKIFLIGTCCMSDPEYTKKINEYYIM